MEGRDGAAGRVGLVPWVVSGEGGVKGVTYDEEDVDGEVATDGEEVVSVV